MVNVSKRTIDGWLRSDPEFPELMAEVEFHKKNFFESGLVGQVEEGNVQSIIFANRTYNRDRGYGEVRGVEHSGTVNHLHAHAHLVLDPEQLGLDLDTTIKVLKALEEKGYRKHQETNPVLLTDYYTSENPMPLDEPEIAGQADEL
jgi:hypothetical protein